MHDLQHATLAREVRGQIYTMMVCIERQASETRLLMSEVPLAGPQHDLRTCLVTEVPVQAYANLKLMQNFQSQGLATKKPFT
jgi:hypothetical protein